MNSLDRTLLDFPAWQGRCNFSQVQLPCNENEESHPKQLHPSDALYFVVLVPVVTPAFVVAVVVVVAAAAVVVPLCH